MHEFLSTKNTLLISSMLSTLSSLSSILFSVNHISSLTFSSIYCYYSLRITLRYDKWLVFITKGEENIWIPKNVLQYHPLFKFNKNNFLIICSISSSSNEFHGKKSLTCILWQRHHNSLWTKHSNLLLFWLSHNLLEILSSCLTHSRQY